jgi:hypothetical protein
MMPQILGEISANNPPIGKCCTRPLILATKACETTLKLRIQGMISAIVISVLPLSALDLIEFIQRLVGFGKCLSAFARSAKEGDHSTRVGMGNSPVAANE